MWTQTIPNSVLAPGQPIKGADEGDMYTCKFCGMSIKSNEVSYGAGSGDGSDFAHESCWLNAEVARYRQLLAEAQEKILDLEQQGSAACTAWALEIQTMEADVRVLAESLIGRDPNAPALNRPGVQRAMNERQSMPPYDACSPLHDHERIDYNGESQDGN